MSALAFVSPWLLVALAALPVIWWWLRITPPRPVREVFAPLRILLSVMKRDQTPASSPWWLTLIRMLLAALVILALAGPVLNRQTTDLSREGPLVLVIDNGWASAKDWDLRVKTGQALMTEASDKDLPVSLVLTAEAAPDATPTRSDLALERLAAARPRPLKPNRDGALKALKSAFADQKIGTLAFITDGIKADNKQELREFAALDPQIMLLIGGGGNAALTLTNAINTADGTDVTLRRLATSAPATIVVTARDNLGRSIASTPLIFKQGEREVSAKLSVPMELRNEFARLTLDGYESAGGVRLLDDSFKRRRVGLLSGEAVDRAQPLLSPLYYIERALDPFADLIGATSPDFSIAVPALITQNPSTIVMADIGRLAPPTERVLLDWIAKGGTLIRFAGPKMAAVIGDDPLVPVRLRKGERALGGAMSWSSPQALDAWPVDSPFAGLEKPESILVEKQVLAEPSGELTNQSWANLQDGTPLVTARSQGSGRIVLFHVSAEAGWSNLPLSGHFVEMLRRVVQLSRATALALDEPDGATLPPFKLLNALGQLTVDRAEAKPLVLTKGNAPKTSLDNPPGLYGSEDGFVALNLMGPDDQILPLDRTGASARWTEAGFIGEQATSLKPPLLLLAFILFMADTIAVLWLGGAFGRRSGPTLRAALVIVAVMVASAPSGLMAADQKPGDDLLLARLDKTHLAYVVTGEDEVDRISERGLSGLTDYIFYRTTLEPGEAVGVDIAKDELSLFPILYWPVSASAPMPSSAAISRIDAYMRAGGTVLFDTRDQFSNLENSASPNTQRLQQILAGIDIPPLEPVPPHHVLTKAFYLLKTFPGRYAGSPLWIEAQSTKLEETGRPASGGDGVSPILITGNDFAGAWAIDQNGAPLLPTIPPDPDQRDRAYRAGLNIVLYMLTGNYKADQVHVPALLERLGQ